MATSKREPGERWNCAACGEMLIGALTIAGKVAPITVTPYDTDDAMAGNVWLGRRKDGTVICATLSGALLEKARAEGLALHLNHFANCPDKARFARAG